ncbi:hypothetical protein [Streptomyces sp. NPDC090080]|uniref:hypothetical protein n=1 Tax=Streptomyces sp. NPDC090080 TaxID=3365939 RepID=UPI003800AB65
MLGEIYVSAVPAMPDDKAAITAKAITAAFQQPATGSLSSAQSAAVDQAIRAMLKPPSPSTNLESTDSNGHGDDESVRWTKLLTHGRLLQTGGQLVWVRPVLENPRPQTTTDGDAVTESTQASPVNEYAVSFAGTASETRQTQTVEHTGETALTTALRIGSSVASAAVIGLPRIDVGAGEAKITGARRNIVSGRKLYVGDRNDFISSVRFRIFKDGKEIVPVKSADTVAPDVFSVRFPEQLSTADEPGFDTIDHDPEDESGSRGDGAVLSDASSVSPQSFPGAAELINAIDMTQPLADLQASFRTQGMSADTTQDIVEQVQHILNERTARNRSLWWRTSGGIGMKIRARGKGNSFSGYPVVHLTLESIQLMQRSKIVKARADLGVGSARTWGQAGENSLTTTASYNTLGLTSLDHGSAASIVSVKGITPASVSLTSAQGWTTTQTSQALSHSVIVSEDAHARYRARMNVSVNWISRTHGKVLQPVTTSTNAEIAVPWRNGDGPREFEKRVLGRVASPYLLRHTQGLDHATPVAAQPFVRTLLAQARIKPSLNTNPPPAYKVSAATTKGTESLHLASRQGLGHAVATALPGAELVVDTFVARLSELSGLRYDDLRIDSSKWIKERAILDHQLAAHFGRPALEGDLNAVLSGVKHTVKVKGKTYELGVRGHLAERIDYAEYSAEKPLPELLNTRAVVNETTTLARHIGKSSNISIGAFPRLSIANFFRMQVGGFTARAKVMWKKEKGLTTGTKSYRRTESEGGSFGHVYNIRYELTLRKMGSPESKAETYWISNRSKGEAATSPDADESASGPTAHIMVPERYSLQKDSLTSALWNFAAEGDAKPLQEAMASMGSDTTTHPTPARQALDFTRGTSGVYPTFLNIPRLAETATALLDEVQGNPRKEKYTFAELPGSIVNATGPEQLASYFGALTSTEGHTIILPDAGKAKPTLTIKLRTLTPRSIKEGVLGTEIEHYLESVGRQDRKTSFGWGLGAQVGIGPQVKWGGEVGGSDTEEPGEHEGQAGGRIALSAQADTTKQWSTSSETGRGFITIDRATYKSNSASTHMRADAVFEISVQQDGKKSSTATVTVADAVDLLVPMRRTEDLVPSHLATPPAVPAGSTSQTRPSNLPPARTYVGGRVPRSSVHVEAMDSNAILPAIREQLAAWGLATNTLSDEASSARPKGADLMRTLTNRYSPEQMKAHWGELLDTGLNQWIPIRGFAGSTTYLWVGVTIEEIGAPREQRDRPDVTLTLRTEATAEKKQAHASGWLREASVAAGVRGGIHDETKSNEEHGGLDYSGRYFDSSSRAAESATKRISIYRASTKDTTYEFTHPVQFKIVMRTTHQLPEILRLPQRALHSLSGSAIRLANFAHGTKPTSSRSPRWSREKNISGSELTGEVRLLAPSHLTSELVSSSLSQTYPWSNTDDRTAAHEVTRKNPHTPTVTPLYPPLFHREYGSNPRWSPNAAVPALPSGDPWRQFLQDFHPWDVPAAGAVQRWAKVAATAGKAKTDVGDGTPWNIPGFDATTPSGMAYVQTTRHEQIRPDIKQLLTHGYRIDAAGQHVTVGFTLSGGRRIEGTAPVKLKARNYTQTDTEHPRHSGREKGWFHGAGPEVGGGLEETAFLGAAPLGRLTANGETSSHVQGDTDERNRESTRAHEYFQFDVTVVLKKEKSGDLLLVDVPGGIIGMLPVHNFPDGDTSYPGGRSPLYPPELFTSPTVAPAAHSWSAENKSSLSPIPEEIEEEIANHDYIQLHHLLLEGDLERLGMQVSGVNELQSLGARVANQIRSRVTPLPDADRSISIALPEHVSPTPSVIAVIQEVANNLNQTVALLDRNTLTLNLCPS